MSFAGIEDFALERYFAEWEFAVQHQLSASDVEGWRLQDLLALADEDARRRWERLALGYTESLGLPALREAIASLYADITPEHVIVLSGAEEGIFLALNASLTAGDEAIVVTPAYQSLHAIPRSLGARVVEVPLREDRRWELDPDEVERHVTRRTRVIAVNYPHNPTGALIDAATQRRLAEIAESARATLFFDEVYRGLERDDLHSLPHAADLSTAAVSLGVMSKSFALAGLRIGWVATRDAVLRERIARLKDYTTICSSAPSELLALIALRARDIVLDRSRAIVRENVRRAESFMTDHADTIVWVPPRAGSTALPRLRRADSAELAARLARQRSTLMLPGHVFGVGSQYFRLGLGRTDFPEALSALASELA